MDGQTKSATIRELHRRAMQRADDAEAARWDGDPFAVHVALEDAAHLEASAADLATTPLDRAVLYRSAAALALEAGWPEKARELALRGLEGAPPEAIADELREVLARC